MQEDTAILGVNAQMKRKTYMKNLAVLTSGGDAPGMNAAIRAVIRTGQARGVSTWGVYQGYSGLIEGNFKRLGPRDVGSIIQRGGTVLGSARCPEFQTEEGVELAIRRLKGAGIDGLVVIGGNGIDFGLRRRGETGWRQVPALPPVGLRLAGEERTAPLGAIGDSAVIDYCGLGGQALASAPQLAREWRDFLPADALTRAGLISSADSGIVSADAVVALGRGPLVNLAILDAAGRAGLIGRGIYEAPTAAFSVI